MRSDEIAPDFGRDAAERAERMMQIGRIYHKWEEGQIATYMAIEKVREVIEPVVVRVGGQHTPEVQS